MGTTKLITAMLLGLLVTLAAGACCAVKTGANGGARHELQARAEKVFHYDEGHRGVLSAAKLRALSVALAFHDDRGSATILAELERE